MSPSVRWYHGGAPGLKVGDYLEPRPPGDTRHLLDGCEVCEARAAGAPLADDDLDPTLVYITSNRLYARLYAHGYPLGTLYRVEPEGPLTASPDPEQTNSYGVPRARIAAIVDPVVRLRPTELRRLIRMADRA